MIARHHDAVLLSVLLLITINILFLDIALLSRTGDSNAVTTALPVEDVRIDTHVIPVATPVQAIVSEESEVSSSHGSALNTLPIQSNAQTHYIHLGSTSSTSFEWEEKIGVEAIIDTRDYTNITSVQFEAFMHLPHANGMMFAKLYNVSDEHDVWFSELTADTSEITRYVADITLDEGENTYRVHMKSSLRDLANLVNARIIISTQ